MDLETCLGFLEFVLFLHFKNSTIFGTVNTKLFKTVKF